MTSTFLFGTVALTPTVMTCTVGLTIQVTRLLFHVLHLCSHDLLSCLFALYRWCRTYLNVNPHFVKHSYLGGHGGQFWAHTIHTTSRH